MPRHGLPSGSAAVVVAVGLTLLGVSLLVARGAPQLPYETCPSEEASSYESRAAGEHPPRGFRHVLPRDAIRPIYNPRFLPAAEGQWLDRVANVDPVSLLDRREIVNDQLSQLPFLVTWCPTCATAMVYRRQING